MYIQGPGSLAFIRGGFRFENKARLQKILKYLKRQLINLLRN